MASKNNQSTKLDILPLKLEPEKTAEKWKKLDKLLPQGQFILVFVAPPRSGKTTTILNMIYNDMFNYKSLYERIIYISPTIMHDRTLQPIRDDEEIIKYYEHEDLDNLPALIQAIIEDQEKAKKEGDEPDTLIILDDLLDKLRDITLSRLAALHRHYKISLILTTQNYKSISPIIRNCTSYWIIFKNHLNKEVKKLEEDFNMFPNFLQLYEACTKQRYSFMFISMDKLKVYRNFNTLVFEPTD